MFTSDALLSAYFFRICRDFHSVKRDTLFLIIGSLIFLDLAFFPFVCEPIT